VKKYKVQRIKYKVQRIKKKVQGIKIIMFKEYLMKETKANVTLAFIDPFDNEFLLRFSKNLHANYLQSH